MNREILIALAGTLLALGVGYAVLGSTPANSPTEDSATTSARPSIPRSHETAEPSISPRAPDQQTAAPRQEVAAHSPPSADPSDLSPLAAADQAWSAAREEHILALEALAASERSLNEVERELDAVERFVEDLEERGEDPADFAEEGMARLRPAIEQFEARLDIVERDERREAEARAKLEAAEAALTRQRALAR